MYLVIGKSKGRENIFFLKGQKKSALNFRGTDFSLPILSPDVPVGKTLHLKLLHNRMTFFFLPSYKF